MKGFLIKVLDKIMGHFIEHNEHNEHEKESKEESKEGAENTEMVEAVEEATQANVFVEGDKVMYASVDHHSLIGEEIEGAEGCYKTKEGDDTPVWRTRHSPDGINWYKKVEKFIGHDISVVWVKDE